MDSQKTHPDYSAKKAYNNAIQSLKNTPVLFTPFIIFAIIAFLSVILIYLAPRMPLRIIFGPPIRTFWGEAFLHYPTNFILLPKLVSLATMALSIIFGSLLTGMAVAMACDAYNKKTPRLNQSFKTAIKKYAAIFLIVFIITAIMYIAVKIVFIGLAKYFIAGHSRLLFLKASFWMGPFLLAANFILAVLIQSAFIYAIPLIIIGKVKLLKSVIKSFVLFKKLFLPTLILVSLPMCLYIPIIILSYNNVFLIDKFFPEIILYLALLGVIVNSLIIDPIITISTTFLYLAQKEK